MSISLYHTFFCPSNLGRRQIERRDKLAKVLFMFHRADIKILPDEKTLLKNSSVNTRTDSTDTTDAQRPEFYTSTEIKNFVPDYKTSIGSRALGILIANNMLYIVYYTADGELLWKHDPEENFLKSTSRVLARKLFGKNYGTYQLVFGDNEKTVAAIMKRYGTKSKGKIYPSADMPDMIFALTNTVKDATLDLILHCQGFINDLKAKYGSNIAYDEKMPFFDGVPICISSCFCVYFIISYFAYLCLLYYIIFCIFVSTFLV